jgi:hypothetical protein
MKVLSGVECAKAPFKSFNKFLQIFINRLWGRHNKFNTVTGSQVKNFGMPKRALTA